MSEPNQFGFTPEQEKEADDIFHMHLGHTLTEWAGIEHAMFSWFWKLSEMSSDNARRVFYSAASLRGKIDMMNGLVGGLHHPSKENYPAIPFLKMSLKKAGDYSRFRNALAHGMVVQTQNDNTCRIVQNGDWVLGESLSQTDLEIAFHNFRSLKYAFRGVLKGIAPKYVLPGNPPPMATEEGMALPTQLPTEPHSREARPILPKILRQQISSRLKRGVREAGGT